ncbi:MAG: tetratricopeptide repeat protein [Elusimicrobiaceae bacterium]|nr:tetratricopeptide repeat protein [Elusimicrobiaceae bacterium]
MRNIAVFIMLFAMLFAGCGKKESSLFENARNEKDPVKAARLYDKILSEHPRHPGALAARGLISLDAGRYTPAIEDFTAAIEADPRSAGPAYNLRARAYARMKLFNKALADVDKAAARNARSIETLDELGRAFLSAGRAADAVRVYRMAVAVNGEAAESRIRLGEALFAVNDQAGAVREFSTVITAAPDKAGRAYLGRCRAQVYMRQSRAALADCAQAADRGVTDALALAADLYSALGDSATAAGLYARYADARPDDYEAAVKLADLLYESGQYGRAADIYERSVRRYAAPVEADCRAVLSLMRANRCETASLVVPVLIKNFHNEGQAYAATAAYQAYCLKDANRALHSMESAFRLGFDRFFALEPYGEYGFFLDLIAKNPQYRQMREAARKNRSAGSCPTCGGKQ